MAIEKITIKKVFQDSTTKDGNQKLWSKGKNQGKPYTTVSIIVDGKEGYFKNNANPGDKSLTITEGQTLVLKLTDSVAADGKTYHNFNFPTLKEMEVYDQFNPQ